MDDLEIMDARDADAEGPACGTNLAATYLRVTYITDGALMVDKTRHCCYRHIPSPQAVLPEAAEIEEIAIEDGLFRTIVNLNGVTREPVATITAIDTIAV